MNITLQCLKGYALLSLALLAFSGFAYHVNSKLEDGNPAKKDFHPAAILMAPLWPVYLLLAISLHILKAILFVVFLILFTVALLVLRKPFILIWLKKVALKIGNKFLQVNTLLIRMFFPQATSKTT